MRVADNDFYLRDKPTYLQQGDVIVDVPVSFLPPSDDLMLLRNNEDSSRIDDFAPGTYRAVNEKSIKDPFADGKPEFGIVQLYRAFVVIATQTCDLDKAPEYMVFSMMPLSSGDWDLGNFRADKYGGLFRFPPHEYFDESYVELTQLKSVPKELVSRKNRIASLSHESQDWLNEKLVESFNRGWGHEPGQLVPEDGIYRCLRCSKSIVELKDKEFKRGEVFRDCENCTGRHKAQWRKLLKFKK